MASARVVGDTINTGAMDASIINTFIDIHLTEIPFKSGQAFASVVGEWIQTFGTVLALVIVAETTLELQIFQLNGRNGSEFTSRWIAQQIGSGEERQQESTDTDLVQTSSIMSRLWNNERSCS